MENKQSDPRTYAIIGAAIEVHNIIGRGHLEAVYHECLEIEFQNRKIEYTTSKPQFNIFYKDNYDELLWVLSYVDVNSDEYFSSGDQIWIRHNNQDGIGESGYQFILYNEELFHKKFPPIVLPNIR